MIRIKKIKHFLATCLLLLTGSTLCAQTTYTVTQSALSGGCPALATGYLDCILNDAMTAANNGQNVTIYFNAPGLVQINYQLPPITISNGSITFDKDPSTTSEQGIQFASTANDNSIGYGFYFFQNTSNSFFKLKNISIKDFVFNPNYFSRYGVQVSDGVNYNFTMDNCLLQNNIIAFRYGRSINMSITNNIFLDNAQNNIFLQENGNNLNETYDSRISGNHVNRTSPSTDVTKGIQLISPFGNFPMKHQVEVDGNLIEHVDEGINIFNGLPLSNQPSSPDLTFQVNIHNNTIQNINGNDFAVNDPYPHFIFTNNTLGSAPSNVRISSFASYFPNPFGMNFVNSNTNGVTVENSGNALTNTLSSGSTFSISQNLGNGIKIIGYNLPAKVHAENSVYSTIRQNKIISNFGFPDKPIELIAANGNIVKPVLTSAVLNTNLTMQYTLATTLSNTNAPFIVDFYKSNSNGDLLDYLGKQTISTLSGATYTSIITVPLGVNLNGSDRIASTVTSIGTSNANTFGTSEVAYISITPCANCTVPQPCENCISSFAPVPDSTYLIGAWVKEGNSPQSKTSYNNPQIFIDFPGTGQTFGPFTAKGQIIDGWQRVEETFKVPHTATSISIKLLSSTGDCFFDDIRIFPKDGSMKSYVYDPVTLRLSAELDERNYATIYEYDEEGKLIRVKKETERGVMTIKEAKNSIIKR